MISTQILFSDSVTKEQEAYAKGFELALQELHNQQNSTIQPNSQSINEPIQFLNIEPIKIFNQNITLPTNDLNNDFNVESISNLKNCQDEVTSLQNPIKYSHTDPIAFSLDNNKLLFNSGLVINSDDSIKCSNNLEIQNHNTSFIDSYAKLNGLNKNMLPPAFVLLKSKNSPDKIVNSSSNSKFLDLNKSVCKVEVDAELEYNSFINESSINCKILKNVDKIDQNNHVSNEVLVNGHLIDLKQLITSSIFNGLIKASSLENFDHTSKDKELEICRDNINDKGYLNDLLYTHKLAIDSCANLIPGVEYPLDNLHSDLKMSSVYSVSSLSDSNEFSHTINGNKNVNVNNANVINTLASKGIIYISVGSDGKISLVQNHTGINSINHEGDNNLNENMVHILNEKVDIYNDNFDGAQLNADYLNFYLLNNQIVDSQMNNMDYNNEFAETNFLDNYNKIYNFLPIANSFNEKFANGTQNLVSSKYDCQNLQFNAAKNNNDVACISETDTNSICDSNIFSEIKNIEGNSFKNSSQLVSFDNYNPVTGFNQLKNNLTNKLVAGYKANELCQNLVSSTIIDKTLVTPIVNNNIDNDIHYKAANNTFHSNILSEMDQNFDGEDGSGKLEMKRARNRVAAQRCRTRKIERINELSMAVNELKSHNDFLVGKKEILEKEILAMEDFILRHSKMGCNFIA